MKIKKYVIASALLILAACGSDSGNISSSQIEEVKQTALDACNQSVDHVPEEMQAQVKEICECSAEKTDYAALAELGEAGDTETIMKMTMDVAKQCSGM